MEENKLPVVEGQNENSSTVKAGNDRFRRQRIAGVFVYCFSVLLTWTIMANRHAPVNTFLDVLAWLGLFFAISFLTWLIPMTLVARYMEISSKLEDQVSTTRK